MGGEQQLLGWVAGLISLVAIVISLDQPQCSEWIAKRMWALANVLFSICLAIVGFLPSSGMAVSPKLLLKSWVFALFWILIGAVASSLFTSRSRQDIEERKVDRERLSMLWLRFLSLQVSARSHQCCVGMDHHFLLARVFVWLWTGIRWCVSESALVSEGC